MNTWFVVMTALLISAGDRITGHWGTEPLGPKVAAAPFEPAPVVKNLFLRPNAFHQGHGMPGVFVTKLDRDIKRGMIAAEFDSVLHHWATQFLNYYVLAKLLWDPSQDAEAIVRWRRTSAAIRARWR
jgi:hypothetical protein